MGRGFFRPESVVVGEQGSNLRRLRNAYATGPCPSINRRSPGFSYHWTNIGMYVQ
jgi:hypothetical protein